MIPINRYFTITWAVSVSHFAIHSNSVDFSQFCSELQLSGPLTHS